MSLRYAIEVDPDWWEIRHLVSELVADPATHVSAALAGMTRPWSVEAWILAELLDVTVRANSRRSSTPYPRPNDEKRFGCATRRTQAEIRAALADRGHTIAEEG